MKKIVISAITLFVIFSIIPNFTYATRTNLIQNMQISLKSRENPNRLEVSFELTEAIDLSQGSSNIIYEYFMLDSNGNLEAINYKKDKSWSGYLNSYDNYPSGERKYSSGSEKNIAYSDNVPAAVIYTSTKSSASIDVTKVAAVRVTVTRADGSGEKVTLYSDGTTSTVEKIEIPVADENKSTGIRIQSTTAEIPVDTVLITNKLADGPVFELVSAVLKDVKDFLVFDIKLESDGQEIQANGMVKISIPIPEDFSSSHLAVYRIDSDGTKTPYSVTVMTLEEVNYATFETDHFSTYILAEINEAEKIQAEKIEAEKIEAEKIKEQMAQEEALKKETTQTNEQQEKQGSPKTGTTQTVSYLIAIIILSAIGIIVTCYKKLKAKNI